MICSLWTTENAGETTGVSPSESSLSVSEWVDLCPTLVLVRTNDGGVPAARGTGIFVSAGRGGGVTSGDAGDNALAGGGAAALLRRCGWCAMKEAGILGGESSEAASVLLHAT